MKHTITLLPDNNKVSVPEGTSILEAVNNAGVNINNECGGAGICGKCRVKLLSGKITSHETFILSESDRQAGYILACTSFPSSDLTLELPPSAIASDTGIYEKFYDMFRKIEIPYKFDPLIKKVYVECPLPDSSDNRSDLDRLYTILRQKTGIKNFQISPAMLRRLPDLCRNSSWKVTVTFNCTSSPHYIMEIEEGDTSRFNCGIVIDAGTTSIEAVAVDMVTGNILHFTSVLNPQTKHGVNISDRLNFASTENGLLILNDLIIDRINEIIAELIFESGMKKECFKSIIISCNTVMMHFILCLNTDRILRSPNVPVALEVPPFTAQDINLYPGDALVFFTACPGSFVGGDVVSAIISTGLPQKDYLLADIGTNGEVAASIDGAVIFAATSAGPAFEGGGIKWGKRASDGAISRFYYNRKMEDFSLMTIGNKTPNGITGVGLIDFLATLFLAGYVDKKGKFRKRSGTKRFKYIDGEEHFIIYLSDKNDETITVTEKELSYLIHSKGALYSGLEFLTKRFEKTFDEIDNIYISGAMGGGIDVESGITIGLFPDIDRKKFIFLGNGSLRGSLYMLLSGEAWEKGLETARSGAYFDLGMEPDYMNSFISSLFLPHTDLNLFPNIISKLPEKNSK